MLNLLEAELKRVLDSADSVQQNRAQLLKLARSQGKLLMNVVEGGLANMEMAGSAVRTAQKLPLKLQTEPSLHRVGKKASWTVKNLQEELGWRVQVESGTLPPSPEELVRAFTDSSHELRIGAFTSKGLIGAVRHKDSWSLHGPSGIDWQTGDRVKDTDLNKVQSPTSIWVFPERTVRILVPICFLGEFSEDLSESALVEGALEGESAMREEPPNFGDKPLHPAVEYGIEISPTGEPRIFLESS